MMEIGSDKVDGDKVFELEDSSTTIEEDKCYSSMSHFFICSSSCPPFNAFREDRFLQMMNAVSVENDFKPLTISHLKICLNAEHNTFEKSARQAALDHHEEANEYQFYQFAHDGATLHIKNK